MSNEISIKKISTSEFNRLEKALLPVVVPLEQSPAWGAFDNAVPGREFLGSFGFYGEKKQIIALGSATLYKQKGRNWIWFKHGPLFATEPNTETVQKMCSALKKYFARSNDVPILYLRLTSPTKAADLVLPYEHTMYDQTVIIDLTRSEEEILSDMSQGGRRGIRAAQKAGIAVEEVTTNKADFFTRHCYPILEETGLRDGFGIHPLRLYISMMDTLPDIARLYVAKDGPEVLAWAINTEYNTQAMYYYGGSSARARNSSAAYLLQWEMIKAAKSRGNKSYDFMGIAGKNYEGLKNVTQFKTKFAKSVVDIPFTYDLPINKLRYFALTTLLKAKRQLRR